ncbi:MAG: hypothetical protein CVV33_01060, partial [Methanomicrobiales archaeon HGW-Methanomicrobiales-4]
MKHPPKTVRKDPHEYQLREEAEGQLARSDNILYDLSDKTPEEIIHELRVNQIELEVQNQDLKKAYQDLKENEENLLTQLEEIRKAKEKLQVSEERFRKLFLENIAGYALHEIICDESGIPIDYRFLEVNPAFERLTGLCADDLIGRTVLEVLPKTESYWIDKYGQVALTGTSTHFENYSRELDKYYEVTAYCPVIGQFATLILDITERKLA